MKTTIYFDSHVLEALKREAAARSCSISDLVNDAVRSSLNLNAGDLAAFAEGSGEPDLPFDQVVRDLRRSGEI